MVAIATIATHDLRPTLHTALESRNGRSTHRTHGQPGCTTKPPDGRMYAALRRGRLTWPDPSDLARRDDLAQALWNDGARLVGPLNRRRFTTKASRVAGLPRFPPARAAQWAGIGPRKRGRLPRLSAQPMRCFANPTRSCRRVWHRKRNLALGLREGMCVPWSQITRLR